MGRRGSSYNDHSNHYELQNDPGVFGWIIEEAQEQVADSCTGTNYDADKSNTRSGSVVSDIRHHRNDADSSSYGYVSDVSSRVSLDDGSSVEGGNLRKQAHKLTQRIRSLNSQHREIDYSISRERSILASSDEEDEEGTTSSFAYTSDGSDHHRTNTIATGPSKLICSRGKDEEEGWEEPKQKKKWMNACKSNKNRSDDSVATDLSKVEKVIEQDHRETSDDLLTVIDVFGGNSDEDGSMDSDKRRTRRKIILGSLVALMVVLVAAAVACGVLVGKAKNVDDSADPSKGGVTTTTSGLNNVADSPTATVRDSPWADTTVTEESLSLDEEEEEQPAEAEIPPSSYEEPSAEAEPTEEPTSPEEEEEDYVREGTLTPELISDIFEDDPESTDDGEDPSTSIPASSSADGEVADYADSIAVDPELLEKHLEAYERWKEENGFLDDDDEPNSRGAVDKEIEEYKPYYIGDNENNDDNFR